MSRTIYPGVFDEQLYHALAVSNNNPYVLGFNKFAYNPDVDTATEEDVWDFGGNYEYADSPDVLRFASSSSEDAVGGNGVYLVEVYGLDENMALASEQVTLTGTTPVLTTGQFSRIYRVRALASSNADVNSDLEGNLSVFNNAENKLQAYIAAGNTSTKMSHFSIPAGYTGFMTSIFIFGGPNDDFVCDLQVKASGSTLFFTAADVEITNSNFLTYCPPISYGPIPENADIKFKASAVSNNAQVRVNYMMTLIENDYLSRLSKSFG